MTSDARLRSMELVGQPAPAEPAAPPPKPRLVVVSSQPRPRVVVVERRSTQLRSVTVPAAPTPPAPYVSAIDPQYPVFGTPTTASVRDNFAAAKAEIDALQLALAGKLDLAGGTMTGSIFFVPIQVVDGGTFS